MSAQPTTDDTTEAYSCDPELNDLDICGHHPEALQELFENLRKAGIVTVEGTACCTGCATAAAAQHADDLEADDQDVIGFAGYHEQDLHEETYYDTGERWRTYEVDSLYVGFDGRGDTRSSEVAGLILEAAHEAGLEADWNGNTAQKVEVYL